MRYSADEMEILEQNPNIRIVTPLTFVMEDSLYESLFKEWMQDKRDSTVEEGLCRRGIPTELTGEQYVSAVVWSFKKNNGLRRHKDVKSMANDIALIASGLFMARRGQVAWKPEFKSSLFDHYPEESFEEGIRRAGLTLEVVGHQRISSLRQSLKVRLDHEAMFYDQNTSENQDPVQSGPYKPAANAWQYMKHPYVSGVSGDKNLTLTEVFYNEAAVLEGMSIQEILQIYEIDPVAPGRNCISEIRMKLLKWKKTNEKQEAWDEQVLRIQCRRLRALITQTENTFARIRSEAKRMRPSQKKQLCRQLSEYPTRPEYPYGYSLRQILSKAGISKTVYYKALHDGEYGCGDERRAARDRDDLEKVVRVMEYKGFEKGIRQIYMMLPDLTGESFAISKIRRLLRQNGIKTKVRGENPSRQNMGKYMERNRKPNLLKREFRLHRPNEVRLTDVTYLDYGTGEEKQRAYGSSCIDPVTGRLLVFHVARNNDLELAMETLEKLSDHPTVEGALFHSDQGMLYFRDEFQKKVAEMGMMQSMSKRGNCWDNAPQESFFGHFKDECGYGSCDSFEELRAMINEYAWYYNNERRQWDRKRMTPVQYEAYLLSLDEEGFAEYMRTEREKYDKMKEKAEEKAILRAKTLGV
ncbi:MAG: IS3 family transposase [Eubacterium sp.]|nr:IS3 family transposase [Eubacterium sp.]